MVSTRSATRSATSSAAAAASQKAASSSNLSKADSRLPKKQKKEPKKPKPSKLKGEKKTLETKKPYVSTQKMWTVDSKPSFVVTAPPGAILTIKQYSDEFIVTHVSGLPTRRFTADDPPIVKAGDIIMTIDGSPIESEDDILKGTEKSREIGFGERVISNSAAAHSKGTLLWLKDIQCALFQIMDYSEVAAKYGEDFLEELSPPQRKRGREILGEAWASLGS